MSENFTLDYEESTTGPIGIVEKGIVCRSSIGYTGKIKMLSPLHDPKPKRILRSGPCTIVFWEDGTKTIVRKAPDEEDNAYAAFTAALAIKAFGSNQAVKRIVEMTETQEKKEKREPDPIVKAYTQDLVNLAEYILEKKEDGV